MIQPGYATCLSFALFVMVAGAQAAEANSDATKLYASHCASCHGADRLGGIGPALLPENLARLRKPEAVKTITAGRAATQMPGFSEKLKDADVAALVALIYTPLPKAPTWGEAEIRKSHVVKVKPGTLPDRPAFKADPLNLFVVVELGDHHVTLLDGDKFEPITRFPTRFALHGGPKYSPDGRFVYFASRDGWVSKYDIWNLTYVAEVRAGINTRNLAVSGDGKYVLVGNYLPHTLVVLDALDLKLLKIIPVADDKGASSRVSAVYDAAPRKSFIAALKDIPEVWEIPYDPNHEPIYRGYVHDFQFGEAIPEKGPFPVRRIKLDDYLDDFFFDPPYDHLVGAARNAKNGQVVNLIVGRKIAETYQGKPVLATPNLKEGTISVINIANWKTISRIETRGAGFFMRSHENTRYAWADNMMSKARDTIEIIDKQTLKVVREITPAPGKTAAHTEFTRDGRFALVSIWEMDGALVIYDAQTFKEVKRLPMKKPSGKYNVFNKISRSEGTSH